MERPPRASVARAGERSATAATTPEAAVSTATTLDRRVETERIGQRSGRQRPADRAGIAPEAIDAERRRPLSGMNRISGRGQQRGIDHRRTQS